MNPPQTSSKKGFAIVIALSLMAFILLLMLSIGSFLQMELNASRINIEQLAARQNALLALNMAIGQLQDTVGPDQRTTARADILSSSNRPDITGGDNGLGDALHTQGTALWTGVWKTQFPDALGERLDSGNTPVRPRSYRANGNQSTEGPQWLVSGTAPDPITAPTGDTITLANYETENAGVWTERTVTVPLVEISSQANGRASGKYAWWTDDESVKARANLKNPWQDPDGSADLLENQLNFLSSQRMAPEVVSEFAALDTNSAQIENVFDWASFALVTGASVTDIPRYRNDFGFYSRSVIADSRQGGLKVDLTAAFSDDTWMQSGNNNGDGQYAIFKGAYGPYDFLGLPWVGLKSYYNLYKSSEWDGSALSGNPKTNIENEGFPARYARISGTENQWHIADGTTRRQGAVWPAKQKRAPVFLTVGVAVGLQSLSNQLHLKYYPEIVIWNPYDVAIESGMWEMEGNLFVGMSSEDQNPYEIEVDGAPLSAKRFNLNDPLVAGGQFEIILTIDTSTTLAPGEVKRYSMASSSVWSSAVDNTFLLVPSSNVDAGLSVPINTGTTYTGTESVAADIGGRNRDNNTKPKLSGPSSPDLIFDVSYAEIIPTNNTPISLGTVSSLSDSNNKLYWWRMFTKPIETDTIINPNPSPLFSQMSLRRVYDFDRANERGHGSSSSTVTDQTRKYSAGMFGTAEKAVGAPLNGDFDLESNPAGEPGNVYWGDATNSVAGVPYISMFEIPRQPALSLGALMSATAATSIYDPTYIIGGSLPPLHIALNDFANTHSGNYGDIMHIDHSFHLNEALFDRYFFSTVPLASLGTSYPPFTAFDDDFVADGEALGNSRFSFYDIDSASSPLPELRNPYTAAAHLLLEGGFNVNSTSVAAWQALLASMSSNGLKIYDASGNPNTISGDETGFPILRFATPRDIPLGMSSQARKSWAGGRSLTNAEIRILAEAIVDEVKKRGPFLGLSDFVNRRIGTADATGRPGNGVDFQRYGILEAALINSNINESALAPRTLTSNGGAVTDLSDVEIDELLNLFNGHKDNVPTTSPKAARGQPSWLTQNDLLKVFAPVLTARSDTFTIRSYGETEDPITGQTLASAYLEAVVQRVPEYLDATDDPEASPTALTVTNQNFGRKFKVISLCWLSDPEI